MNKLSDAFNQPVDRRSQHALKWVKYPEDVLAMWVADSDYKTSSAIQERLANLAQKGNFGYQLAEHTPELNDAVVSWLSRRHNWEIESDWLIWIPGIMSAVNTCCQLFANGQLYIQTPNYYPLLNLGDSHNLPVSYHKTIRTESDWKLDMDKLAADIRNNREGLLILTNPMNPCGSVQTKESLQRIADLCEEYNVTLCSDEVHCDLILDDMPHIPAGSLDAFRNRSITVMSASKAFNVAGLATAYAIIPNPKLRKQFYDHTIRKQLWVNSFGMEATIGAYTESDDWFEAQREHLRTNRDYLDKSINAIDGLGYMPSPATYLAWIDAAGLGVQDPYQHFLDRKVGFSGGKEFGDPGYVRMNFACPKSNLEEAIRRMS